MTEKSAAGSGEKFIQPGARWTDTAGAPIAAHGGGFMHHNGVYYWYGETRESFSTFPGISCYSSRDLFTWKNEGFALLPVKDDPAHDLYYTNIIERPKVIYNTAARQFVMWMHVEDNRYQKACAGVAVSDSPAGPFRYIRSMRPNGHEARDCSLFQDDDGRAYFIHSSESNSTQHINLLTDDYLDCEGSFVRNWIHEWREAPAIFKHDGRYYSLTSLCTGFSPNEALYAVADSMLGEWKIIGNPCKGYGANSCFRSQVTYVQPVAGRPGAYVFMADRWIPSDLADSRYVWLPLHIDNGMICVEWSDQWNFDGRKPGLYREDPKGPAVRAPQKSPDTARAPDVVIKRRTPDQDLSALGWVGWTPGQITVTVALIAEQSSSLDGAKCDAGTDPVDIWIDYHQASVDLAGNAWAVVPGGSGNGDLSGVALTRRHRDASLKCSAQSNQALPHPELLGLPAKTRCTVYSVTVHEAFFNGRAIKAGESFAFSLVLNNRDRNGRGVSNRGYSPAGWRWGDTDTYHRLELI